MAAMIRRINGFRRATSASRALAYLACAFLGLFLAAAQAQALIFAAAASPAPSDQAQPLSEYDVEAAYLYNFGKFVRWPAATADSRPSFDICILGRDPFGGTLDKLIANDNVSGKPIRKRVIGRASQAAGCAIVYIADSEAGNLRRILAAFRGKPELLVSDLPNFADDGGMVEFVLQGDRVRFQVNVDAASRCGLTFRSELLKVAASLIGKPRNGVAR